jgi:hypothetical protein
MGTLRAKLLQILEAEKAEWGERMSNPPKGRGSEHSFQLGLINGRWLAADYLLDRIRLAIDVYEGPRIEGLECAANKQGVNDAAAQPLINIVCHASETTRTDTSAASTTESDDTA